jgi:hypothetical protein
MRWYAASWSCAIWSIISSLHTPQRRTRSFHIDARRLILPSQGSRAHPIHQHMHVFIAFYNLKIEIVLIEILSKKITV